MVPADWLTTFTLVTLVASPLPSPTGPRRCAAVQRAIDARASPSTAPLVLLELGPHFSPRALPRLLELGQQGAFSHRLAAYGAFGLTRHAAGLRQIVRSSAPSDAEGRLAYALATLALGREQGAQTVQTVIRTATVSRRRGAMWVLSRMRHARSRQMLYAGLEDADPEVRLIAAEALVRFRSRAARRTLLELFSSGSPRFRRRASEALIAVGHRFSPDALAQLEPDAAARAFARCAAPSMSLRRLERAVSEGEEGVRAGALAAIAARSGLRSWLDRACPRRSCASESELVMVAAIIGDAHAPEVLTSLTGTARTQALRVFSAFSEIPSVETRIDTSTARRVAAAFERWWPALSVAERARVLTALGAVDAPVSVQLARRVLPSTSGAARIAAAKVLGQHGTLDDAVALVGAVDGPSNLAHGATLAAAARLCRLEGS